MKIPFIVKSVNKYSKLIQISSVFTTDKAEITFERLRYLVDIGEVELLNAVIDNGEIKFNEDFDKIKKDKKHIKNLLSGPIDCSDALTQDQRKLSDCFKGTPFELDVKHSSVFSNAYIESFPVPVFSGKYNMVVSLEQDWDITKTRAVIKISRKRIKNEPSKNAVIYDANPEKLNRMMELINHISDFDDIYEMRDLEMALFGLGLNGLFADILTDYLSNGNVWFKIHPADVENIKYICDQLGIFEEYSAMLRNRITTVKSFSHIIEELKELSYSKFGIKQPNLDIMTLYWSFCDVGNITPTSIGETIQWEVEKMKDAVRELDFDFQREQILKMYCNAENFYRFLNNKLPIISV